MSATFWNIRRRLRQQQADKEAIAESKAMEQEIEGSSKYTKPTEGGHDTTEQRNSSGGDDDSDNGTGSSPETRNSTDQR